MKQSERLKQLRAYLGLTQAQFAKEIGRKQGSISDIERGRNKVDGIAELLRLIYNVDPGWLKEGAGEMLLKPAGEKSYREGVPYFEPSGSGYPALSFLESEPEYHINFRPFNDCTAYLPVFGDSMFPKYASGEIVAVKEVTNYNVILWGEAYLVVAGENANNLRTIKLLFEHQDNTKILLRSFNPDFSGDTVLERSDIISLYLIKGKITRNQM